jgi:hypothetical protein
MFIDENYRPGSTVPVRLCLELWSQTVFRRIRNFKVTRILVREILAVLFRTEPYIAQYSKYIGCLLSQSIPFLSETVDMVLIGYCIMGTVKGSVGDP